MNAQNLHAASRFLRLRHLSTPGKCRGISTARTHHVVSKAYWNRRPTAVDVVFPASHPEWNWYIQEVRMTDYLDA
jgi:hypothetical protein